MKKLRNIKLIALAVATLLSSALMPFASVFAMGASGHFSVGPMNQKIVLTPGETYRGTISVTNPDSATAPFYYLATPAPFTVTNEKYDTDFTKETNYTQIYNWMTIENPEGSVEPNQTANIIFTVNVPEDAPAGGQYGAIRVANNKSKFIEEKKSNGLSIDEKFEIVSVIYASVAGNTVETGNILDNSIPSFVFTAPLSVSSLVEVTGNVHGDAEYTLQVYPLFSDEEIYTNEEEPLSKTIMPGVKRTIVQTWDKTPMVGIFKVKQTVKLFDKTSVAEKIVVVCPVWLLLIIILGIMLIIAYFVAKSKNRKNRR